MPAERRPLHGWLVIDKPLGHHLEPASSRWCAARTGAQGRACRHARPAGDRRSAARARRGDQDRRLCDRPAASATASASAGAIARDTDDSEGEIVAESAGAARRRRRSRRCCRASPARSCSARRPIRRSRSPAAAPMRWRAPASRPSWRARPVEIAELRLIAAARPRPCRFRGAGRRGHLYPRPRPRPGAGARHARPYRRAAPARGRPLHRSASDFAGFGGSPWA